MSDLISRQAAIDEVVNWLKDRMTDVKNGKPLTDRLKDLPSAQPEPQWIPCERELPAVGRSVLISVGGMYTAEGCLREDGDWTQFRWDAIQRKDMVGAWKPLDEPWRGEEHGQDD